MCQNIFSGMKKFIQNNKKSIFGGAVATLLTGLGVFLLGRLSGYEAIQLLESSHNGLNMLCNTLILASATILTLLLTLLGISSSTESKLKNDHYYQVMDIAKLDTILLVGALIMFQLLNIPITAAENVPINWYSNIYWLSLIFSSVLSGMMITLVVMLYTTLINIINIVGLKNDNQLISDSGKES